MADDDERYLVVDGRRWRRQDPSIPDDVRSALFSALGRGRSGVRAGRSAGDDGAVTAARRLVGLAKHGLGERGTPWWEQTDTERRARWEDALAALEQDGAAPDAGALRSAARGRRPARRRGPG